MDLLKNILKKNEWECMDLLDFFKKKERDSLWTGLYPKEGSIKTLKNYNVGIKQGEFKEFYKSGKLKYEAVFNSDTIVGEAKNYFENGIIKAKGNRRNGEWITYYLNGKIASIENFKNGELYGDVVMYNEKGGTNFTCFYQTNFS